MTEGSRYRSIEAVRLNVGLSVQQLWFQYISLSGLADLLEVDAYLHGLIELDPYQEDKLSFALNERLDELHGASRLPYAFHRESAPAAEDPLDVLRELLQAARRGHQPTGDRPAIHSRRSALDG